METEELNLDYIRKAQRKNQNKHAKYLKEFGILELTDDWLSLILDAFGVALQLYDENKDKDFLKAYLMLGSRLLSHYESMRILLSRGLYGDFLIVMRSVLNGTNQLLDLYHNPDNIKDWHNLQDFGPLNKSQPMEIKKLQQKFRDSEVKKRLKSKKVYPHGEKSYGRISETVHASAWGTQFFGRKNYAKSGKYTIQFAPTYDPEKALFLGSMLPCALQDWVYCFVQRCSDMKIHNHELTQLMLRFHFLSQQLQSFVAKFNYMLDLAEEAKERIAAGEDFDQVYNLERFK